MYNIPLEHVIKPARLILRTTPEGQAALNQLKDDTEEKWDSDETMHFLLDGWLEEMGFGWIEPYITGDLTDAPMFAELSDEQEGGPNTQPPDNIGSCRVYSGFWREEGKEKAKHYWREVKKRWAFMQYQVTTPQEELLTTGEAIFDGGEI